MRTKFGVLRVVEVQEGGIWQPWCMCYKNELALMLRAYFRKFGIASNSKCRWRLSNSDKWHVDFVADYL